MSGRAPAGPLQVKLKRTASQAMLDERGLAPPLEGGGQNRSESSAPIVGPTLGGQAAFRIRPNPFDCPLALLRDELTLVAELAPELSRQDKEARPRHLGLSIHH